MQPSSRVAIIGGGLAGLAAARTLQEKGVDYVLFEGTNLLGGRVRNLPYRSGYIQLGAQFINGKKNLMYEIATALKLPIQDLKEFRTFSNKMSAKFDLGEANLATQTLAQVFTPAYEKWLQQNETRLSKRVVFDRLAQLYATYYETEWSGPFDRIAIQNFAEWDDYGDGTEYALGPLGFKAILDNIKTNVNEVNVRYNSTVQKIDYSGAKARLTLSTAPIDQSLLFDYVIVTCSLGHLKRFASSLFTPLLPSMKQEAIQKLGMGNMMKVFLEYEKDWWKEDSILVITDSRNTDTRSVTKNTFRVFTPLEWERNMLICWLAGDGPSLISNLDDATLAQMMTERLREGLNNQTIPLPKSVIRMNWSSNPLFLGSYSFITPEAATLGDGDPYSIMAEPVRNAGTGKAQILFAGEATHSNLYQTTSGAYLSGQREAKRILKLERIK
ncbi:unnamed protein product, partial [Mesorhabditis belari]|uniref:Amine oxidase domain-containing protein n=1 Tax=Mesorhabditis belari TaxID=2138241 RepID=A0AAF3FDH8_9BILA